MSYPEAGLTFVYADTAARVSQVTRAGQDGSSQELSFTYGGSLPSGRTSRQPSLCNGVQPRPGVGANNPSLGQSEEGFPLTTGGDSPPVSGKYPPFTH